MRLDAESMTERGDLAQGAAHRRAARAVIVLGLRSVVVQLCMLAGTVVLSRTLEPADFGVFAVLQFVLAFFQYFGDAGMGAALIQRADEPTERALSSLFTAHLALGVVVVAILWLAAPAMVLVWPDLPPGSPWLLRATSVAFLFTSLRVVPSLLMERRLRFGAIAAAEVGQVVGFYAVASICALSGLKDWTWPLALVAQSAIGTLVLWVAQPWRPRLGVDRAELKPLLRFGLPFQLKNVVGFVNSSLTPVFGGAVLGPAAVGLVNWGQSLAYTPLRLVELVARVAFPLFSRMQMDRHALARVFERAMQFCAFGVFFTSAILLTAGKNVTLVVFTEKWLAGLLALHAFAALIVIGFVTPVVAVILDALGRPGVIARMSIGWAALNWVVTPLATWRWGFPGFVYGYCVHTIVGNVAVLVAMRTLMPEVRLARALAAPAAGGLVVAALGWFVLRPWANTPLRLALGIALALLAHVTAYAVADPDGFKGAWQLVAGGAGARPIEATDRTCT